MAALPASFWESWSVYRSWYMFRALFALSLYLWLWGFDLWVFQRKQFNHGFIIGADPTTLLRVPHVWNVAAVMSATTMLFTCLFVLAWTFPTVFAVDPEIFAMFGLVACLLLVVAPFGRIAHTKRFLLRSFAKQIISPFSTVEFIDFFLADQWTSLFTLVVDLAFSACYMVTGDFLLSDAHKSQCDTSNMRAGISLLKLIPYWIRFWQCIRRAYDKWRDGSPVHWHLANAGKYGMAISVVLINAVHIHFRSLVTESLAVGFGAFATLYAYAWDIYKDWGLLRCGANERHPLLRQELRYPPLVYYAAMVVNGLLRVAWAVGLYPKAFGIDDFRLMHYMRLPLECAEIIRRCLWNLFRIENEHLNNCGEFRILKDIPIEANVDVEPMVLDLHNEENEENKTAIPLQVIKCDRESALPQIRISDSVCLHSRPAENQ